jgi:hypothetical protein
MTGHYPVLVGLDFMHQVGKNSAWYTDVEALRKCVVHDAESYWRRGGILAICWHWAGSAPRHQLVLFPEQ